MPDPCDRVVPVGRGGHQAEVRHVTHPAAEAELRDVHVVLGVDEDVVGAVHEVPAPEVLARRREELDARILPIRHIHGSGGVHRDAVRQIELSGRAPGPAPRECEVPFRIEAMHPGVPVAVRHVHAPVTEHGHVRHLM